MEKTNIFKRIWGGIVKHKTWSIVLLVAIVAATFLIIGSINRRSSQSDTLQTTPAERGTLIASIGATGNVRANQSVILAWQTSGTVESVDVKIGDMVIAGDVLAKLSNTSLSQNLILAQADLVAAEKNLETLIISASPRARAQLTLVEAQKKYDSAKYTLDGMLATHRGATSDAVRNAEAQYTLAEQALEQAETFYNYVKDKPDDNPDKARAFTNLYAARQALERAKNTRDYYLLVPSGRDIEKARAELAVAEAALEDAKREWERLKDGPDPDDVLAAQARVDSARAAVEMAKIIAPFEGTVTDIVPIPGDRVAPGTVGFRIDDLSRLLVDVQVSEVDINKIEIGQDVTVTFDAVLGLIYHGRVVEVDQAATIVGGVVNFGITVELTDADALVKPGMTAAVTITIEQLEDVLLVPNRAVRLLEGSRYVFVQRGTSIERVEITLGASSDTVSQVVAGELVEGDLIVLNPPIEFVETGGPPGFMMP